MLVLDMLDGGHQTEDEESGPIRTCEHARPSNEVSWRVWGLVLKHSPQVYHQRISSLRFKPYPSETSLSDVFHTYLEPVVSIYNKYLLEGTSLRFTYETQSVQEKQVARIYVQDGDHRRLHLILHFIPKGQFCWAGLPNPERFIECTEVSRLVEEFQRIASQEHPKFFVVTDTERVLLISHIRNHHVTLNTSLVTYLLAPGRQSLRHALSLLFFQAEECDTNVDPWPKFLQGALNDPSLNLNRPSQQQQQYTTFHDFDRFTLQRNLPYLEQFLIWKSQESKRLSAPFIGPGTMLDVDANAFLREEIPWRCRFPNPSVPPSTKEFVGRNPRQRLRDVDEILSNGQNITFEVTEVVRHERDTFSQVFFGVLRAADGRVSAPICVKIFLDLLFPVDAELLLDDFGIRDAMWRLRSLHYPEDLVKREEAAYERLHEHQGTMVPHCYGFHRITLQGKFTAYAALLEIIPGPTLAEVDTWNWSDRDAATHGFTQHVRECLRTLLYAGINQADFRPSQIMLPDGPGYRPERDSVVLIDFGFALQRFGDEQRRDIPATMQNRNTIDILELNILSDHCQIHTDFRREIFEQETCHWNEW
ncbi:hypothetical protein MIND_00956800 [Mycena indigotica]|uniref:Uncharacterized protein n=1 Tax=Mycena indigotica TaxID=2126181 RepID=A0A8H6SF64_9AGAR|nr:uncharacterized protein MIND_00956800 [Mycena indigotica]KAF7297237.1 hypothetical protein MIND_00956800 [Mycena indigotica]